MGMYIWGICRYGPIPVYGLHTLYVHIPVYTGLCIYVHIPCIRACIHRVCIYPVYTVHTLYIAILAYGPIPVYALYGIGLFYAGFAYTAGPV